MKNRRSIISALGVLFVAASAVVAVAQTTPTRARANLYFVTGSPTGTPVGYVELTETGGAYLQDVINVSGKVPTNLAGQRLGFHLYAGPCSSLQGHLGGPTCNFGGAACDLDTRAFDGLCDYPSAPCASQSMSGNCVAIDGSNGPCELDDTLNDNRCDEPDLPCGHLADGEGGPTTCSYTYQPCGGMTLGASAPHPHHIGDLPNVAPSSSGTFSQTKATNRFTLSRDPAKPWQQSMNAWQHSPVISAVIDQSTDHGEGGSPMLCGELNCAGGSCSQGGAR